MSAWLERIAWVLVSLICFVLGAQNVVCTITPVQMTDPPSQSVGK